MEISLCDIVAYHKEVRIAFFTASFTLGSFLLTMKSFIVQTLKREVYDKLRYQKRVAERKGLGQKASYYKPLKNFSLLLTIAIASSFLNALFQISVGYIPNIWAVVFCLGFAFSTLALLFFALYMVTKNISIMINLSEDEAIENEQKQK